VSLCPAEPTFADPELERALADGRPTWALIDLDALVSNLAQVRSRLSGKAEVLAVVKADAYGMGAEPVARALEEEGVSWFGVAALEEGRLLRRAGVRGRILMLGGFFPEQGAAVVREGFTPVVFSREAVKALAIQRAPEGRPVNIHLKVDTGMGRLGVPFADLPALLDACPEMAPGGPIRIEGLMTHLARAGEEGEAALEMTRAQMGRFDEAHEILRRRGHGPLLRHAANSAASLRALDGNCELVRPGLALYGADPSGTLEMDPVLHWCSRILFLKEVQEGATVGYGATWRAPGPRRIATLPVGYHDGYDRRLSGRGVVRVGGRRCPVVGTVSMDLVTADVTGAQEAGPGRLAWLLGGPPGIDPPVGLEEMAASAQLLTYEVLCGIRRRVPRLFLRSGTVVTAQGMD